MENINDNTENLSPKQSFKLNLKTTVRILWILHHFYATIYLWGVNFEDSESEHIRIYTKYPFALGTLWCFIAQIIFLVLAVASDLAEWTHSGHPMIKKLKYRLNIFYCAIVLPCTVFVTSMFWIIYSLDRELVYPRALDALMPWSLNQCVHTNIIFVIALETLIEPRRQSVNGRMETYLNVLFITAYLITLYSVRIVVGLWVYRLFAVMNWWQFSIFQAVIFLAFHCYYKIQFPINRFVHGSVDYEDVLKSVKQRYMSTMLNGSDLDYNNNMNANGKAVLNKIIN